MTQQIKVLIVEGRKMDPAEEARAKWLTHMRVEIWFPLRKQKFSSGLKHT